VDSSSPEETKEKAEAGCAVTGGVKKTQRIDTQEGVSVAVSQSHNSFPLPMLIMVRAQFDLD